MSSVATVTYQVQPANTTILVTSGGTTIQPTVPPYTYVLQVGFTYTVTASAPGYFTSTKTASYSSGSTIDRITLTGTGNTNSGGTVTTTSTGTPASAPRINSLPASTTNRFFVEYYVGAGHYMGIFSITTANVIVTNTTTYRPVLIVSVTNPVYNNDAGVVYAGGFGYTPETTTPIIITPPVLLATTSQTTPSVITLAWNLPASGQGVDKIVITQIDPLLNSTTLTFPASDGFEQIANLNTAGLYTFQAKFLNSTINTLSAFGNQVSFNRVAQNVSVVVKAANGTQQTFILTVSDASGINPINVVSSTPTTLPTNATLQDVLNFFLANGITPSGTPPPTPTNFIATPLAVDSISLSWTEPTYTTPSNLRYLVRRNAAAITNNYALLNIIDTGLTASTTYQYTVIATDIVTGLSSAIASVSGTTLSSTPIGTNFGFTVQTACGVLRVVATPSEYNTWTTANNTNKLQTIIQGNPNVPNSLTYSTFASGNLTDTSNFINQLAQISNCYKTITPPPPPTPKNWGQIIFGVFSAGVVASLLTGNGFKKGSKR